MKYNILCVDDIQTNLFILKTLFKKHEEFELFYALSGQEAFEILLKNKIDLILLDIMMPEMDGFEVAKLIKQNTMTVDIPIIFVTAKTDEASLKEAFEKGAVDYITKPYQNYELMARVKMHLDIYTSHKELIHKEYLLEQIINQQQNLVIITDTKNITMANKAFLNFFDYVGLSDIQKNNKRLNDLFEKDNEFYNLGDTSDIQECLKNISQNQEKDFITVMKNSQSDESHAFIIKSTKIKNKESYIVVFTDITNTVMTSKKYEKKALYDTLTGLYNREKLNDFLKFQMNISRRYKTQLSIILFDIDDFKHVNDTYGHIVGDKILCQLSALVQKSIRNTDIVARWGGEEFMIVAPEIALNSAKIVAENVRILINEDKFPDAGTITCSFGVTSYKINESIEEFIDRADVALYEAKNSGKNRVCAV